MKKYFVRLDKEFDEFWRIEIRGSTLTTSRGKIQTIGQTKTQSFSTEDECLNKAERLITERLMEGYTECTESFPRNHELPDALKEALTDKRIVETIDGEFTIGPLQDVRLITVSIDHYQFDEHDGIPRKGNPYVKKRGMFCTTAYALVVESPGVSDPDEILVWLPQAELFGCWNADTLQLYIYPDANWDDIEADLPTYLLTRWGYNAVPNILCCINVWEYFDFIPRDLHVQVRNILSLPDDEKQYRTAEFLAQYERKLLSHPYCTELDQQYQALIALYNNLAQSAEEAEEYTNAITWFERSLIIVNQSHDFRSILFVYIFLHLSFCCLEISAFDLALKYINNYQLFSGDPCDDIRTSIWQKQQSVLRNGVMEISRQQ